MSIDKTYIDYETYKKSEAEVERLKKDNEDYLKTIDELHVKNDDLKQENKALRESKNVNLSILEHEIEELRETLRKAYSHSNIGVCEFCGRGEGHTEDCEYIRLIGGSNT